MASPPLSSHLREAGGGAGGWRSAIRAGPRWLPTLNTGDSGCGACCHLVPRRGLHGKEDAQSRSLAELPTLLPAQAPSPGVQKPSGEPRHRQLPVHATGCRVGPARRRHLDGTVGASWVTRVFALSICHDAPETRWPFLLKETEAQTRWEMQ